MRPLISFAGARATAIRDDSGGIKVLLTCMMDEQATGDNGNGICEVLYMMLV